MPTFLEANCADPALRAEVERLLSEHQQAGSFLSNPILNLQFESAVASGRFQAGELLAGRFNVIRFIASGGMGEVYEAEDIELKAGRAIKIIRPEILNQSNAVARFRREVRLAQQVTHPNVCRVFDIFRHKSEVSGIHDVWLVSMELLHGETLADRLKEKGRMTLNEALPLINQMTSALSAAHRAGIVHRDFKPGNVMLVASENEASDRAVVTDFGLAVRSVRSAATTSLVTGNELFGSPAYMSPEQIEDRIATPASDIYALGLVIYEMVTGKRPIEGDTPISIAAKRLSQDAPSPRVFRPELSSQWENVILRCLERNPARRFREVEEITAGLSGEDATQSGPRTVVPTRESPRIAPSHRFKAPKSAGLLWVGIVVVVFLVSIAAFLFYRHLSLPPQVAEVRSENKHDAGSQSIGKLAQQNGDGTYWQGINQNNPAELELYLQKYPNGEFADLAKVRLKELKHAGGLPSDATKSGPETSAPISAAGGGVLVSASQPWTDTNVDVNVGDLISINASGGIRFSEGGPVGSPNGDGKDCHHLGVQIRRWTFPEANLTCHSMIGKIGLSGAIFEVGSSGRVRAPVPGRLYLGVNDNFFPDNSGSWTAKVSLEPMSTRPSNLGEIPSIVLERTLTGEVLYPKVAYLPDGHLLASITNQSVRLWDPRSGSIVRSLIDNSQIMSFALSPDGRVLASGTRNKTITFWDVGSGNLIRTLSPRDDEVWTLAFSPDGRSLGSAGATGVIKLWDANTGEMLRHIDGHRNWVLSLAFSPDGHLLASGSRDRTLKLWDPNTGELVHSIANAFSFHIGPLGQQDWPPYAAPLTFSSDGRWLASGSGEGTIRLWDTETGTSIRVLPGHSEDVFSLAFTPDNQLLASGSGDKTIKIWNTNTGDLLTTLTGHTSTVHSLAFSPDGVWLASASNDGTIKLWRRVSNSVVPHNH